MYTIVRQVAEKFKRTIGGVSKEIFVYTKIGLGYG